MRALIRVLTGIGVLLVLLTLGPVAARAAGGVHLVTVHRTPQGVTAVVEVQPAPLAPLARDAVTVRSTTSGARPLATTVSPVLDLTSGTALGLVVDGSSTGPGAGAQTLSGATGLLLRIPNDTPVAVVADGASPRLLTPASAHPAEAIAALTRLASAPAGSSGNASTVAALDLVARQLPATPGRARIVVLTTAAPAPGGTEANALVDRFVAAGVVLAVVGTGQAAGTWQSVAAGTGGTAITAVPADPATAYDRLTSTLQSRYVVRFAPPAGLDRVQLAVTSAGQRQTAELALSQAASNAAPSSTTPAAAKASSPSALLWILVAVVVLVALVAAGALLLRRRRAGRAHPDLVPAVVAPVATQPDPALVVPRRPPPPVLKRLPPAAKRAPAVPEAAVPAAVKPDPAPAGPDPAPAVPEAAAAAAEPDPVPAVPDPAPAVPEVAAPEAAVVAVEPDPAPAAPEAAVPEAAVAAVEPDPVPAAPGAAAAEPDPVPAVPEAAVSAAEPDPADMPGVRVFDVSDPGRPTEITPNADNGDFENPWPPPSRPEVAPAAEPEPAVPPGYVGRHRAPGGADAVDEEADPEPGVVDSGGSRARSR